MTDSGPNPYHLEAPARILSPAMTFTCPVCGRERTLGLRVFGAAKDRAPHAGCDRDMARWRETLAAADQDPAYLAACDTAADLLHQASVAQDAAHTAWEAAARPLGVPDWFVTRLAAERHLDDLG